MAALLNRARMTTATTGTGTVTLGSAVTGYASFAEAGAVNATVYSYCIEDGDDFEIGVGTYTSSGTTFSRDTVTLSKISGTSGTSKINLSGTAEIFITAREEDLRVISVATTISVPTDYSTLNAAFTYLDTYRLTAKVTIQIEAGTQAHTALVEVRHPDAKNIEIIGVSSDVTVSSVGSATGSAWAWDVPFTLADATGVSVGHFLRIAALTVTTDDDGPNIEGTWEITDVTGSVATVRIPSGSSSFPAISDTNFAAKVLKSILTWDSTATSGVLICGTVLGKSELVVFDGGYDVSTGEGSDSGGAGVAATGWNHPVLGDSDDYESSHGGGTFYECAFVRWQYNGIVAHGAAQIDASTSHACSNGWRGMQSGGAASSVYAKSSVASCNRKSGHEFEASGALNINNSIACGNGEGGVSGIGGGDAVGTGMRISRNTGPGIDLRYGSQGTFNSSVIRDNTTYAVYARGATSYARIDSITTSGNSTAALRAEDGAVIHAATSAPTVGEATAYSTLSTRPGIFIISGVNGVITNGLFCNSVLGSNAGWQLSSTSAGEMVFATRPDGSSSTTNRLIIGNTDTRPNTDVTHALGRSTSRFNGVWTNGLLLVDGVTAPSTVSGHAQIYVDTADGDLKVKFGDGTVKTIVVDT